VITRFLQWTPRIGVAAIFIFLGLAAAACRGAAPEVTPTLPATAAPPTHTPTPFQPSPTLQPLAARVNGEVIPLEQFQAELARYQAAVGTQLATEDEQRVLNDLIDRLLLAQAAGEEGYSVEDASVQRRMDELASSLESDQGLVDWMADQGYTEESLRGDLASSMAAAWMRDKIVAGVPTAAEQVHARQILLYNSEDAAAVIAQLGAGDDFAALAAQYDPVGHGDLGWFPHGYLTDERLEQAAFQLQPGETSPVIETSLGYHIVQVIERDPARPLEPDALLRLQEQALQEWLATRRAQSDIQVLLP